MTRELVTLFIECDENQDSTLEWDELIERFSDERIRAYFMSLDLDITSVGKIFDLLDNEDRGVVELDDFLEGCLTFRGAAKAVDISLLRNENEKIMKKLMRLEEKVAPESVAERAPSK